MISNCIYYMDIANNSAWKTVQVLRKKKKLAILYSDKTNPILTAYGDCRTIRNILILISTKTYLLRNQSNLRLFDFTHYFILTLKLLTLHILFLSDHPIKLNEIRTHSFPHKKHSQAH